VAASQDAASEFNPHARRAIPVDSVRASGRLSPVSFDLTVGPLAVDANAQMVHGAITHEDDYIFTGADATENLRLADKRVTFFGIRISSGLCERCSRQSSVAPYIRIRRVHGRSV
jgi:hypothetical protein